MFKIVRTEALTDAIYLMDVEAPRVAKNCLPGQFVIVRGSEDEREFLLQSAIIQEKQARSLLYSR